MFFISAISMCCWSDSDLGHTALASMPRPSPPLQTLAVGDSMFAAAACDVTLQAAVAAVDHKKGLERSYQQK